jgi:site-specific DNA-cytosine methylase
LEQTPDVLVINSYAGSLVLGAKAAGCSIRGSYEDDGFGIAAQKLNFPGLKFVDKLPWPEDNLKKTVVIAHPPCAPFSIMNPHKGSGKHTGTTADGFKCHRQVMEYSLGQNCKALAIESVPGVLKAADEYAAAAKKHGYSHFFLRVNSISFGVPQWRPRVWIIFTKKDQHFRVDFSPIYKPLSSIIQQEGTATERGTETHIILRRLVEAKVSTDEIKRIFEGEYGAGTLLQIGQTALNIEDVGENFAEVRKAWNLGGLFAAMMPRVLDPTRWAPTVLGGSAWFINGRPLFLEEFNLIMGFPIDYKWPESFSDPRMYLSKGVCPPVAKWILEQVMKPFDANHNYHSFVETGGIIDLNPKKAEVEEALDGKPRDPLGIKPKTRKARVKEEREVAQPRTRRTASEQMDWFLNSLNPKSK